MMETLAQLFEEWNTRIGLPPDPIGMRAALRAAGSPDEAMRCIHVAGTNGKGSVAVMLAGILQLGGLRTGLFTSPHLHMFTERIRVNGEEISEAALLASGCAAMEAEHAAGVRLNYFALAVLTALVYFRGAGTAGGCDCVVLEAGLGGRLDPTNAIAHPTLSILTKIGMDHADALGNTLAAIATEKAGIIREYGNVVSAPQEQEVQDVLNGVCAQKQARLWEAAALPWRMQENIPQVLHAGSWHTLGMHGAYQAENAGVVLTAIEALREQRWNISQQAIREGLQEANWPARFELLSPRVVLDGAHNPQGACVLRKSLAMAYPGTPCVIAAGFMRDKDVDGCLEQLAPIAQAMIALPVAQPRAIAPDALARLMHRHCANVYAASDLQEGLRMAKRLAHGETPVVICGSLYMAGEVRAMYRS